SEQFATAITERLQDSEFAKAFADGHAHGAGAHAKQGEHDYRADRIDEDFHVAHHRDEAELESTLGFSAYLGGSVFECGVDPIHDRTNLFDAAHAHPPCADQTSVTGGFVEIF